jgi:hypothetical protein
MLLLLADKRRQRNGSAHHIFLAGQLATTVGGHYCNVVFARLNDRVKRGLALFRRGEAVAEVACETDVQRAPGAVIYTQPDELGLGGIDCQCNGAKRRLPPFNCQYKGTCIFLPRHPLMGEHHPTGRSHGPCDDRNSLVVPPARVCRWQGPVRVDAAETP